MTLAAFEPAAHHRHVAGVIGDAVLLLVGGLVFLVDDDEAEPRERQEQRGAGAGDDLHLALGDAAPEAGALAGGDAGMPFRRAGAETRRRSGRGIAR